MYINLWIKFSGASPKILVLGNFLKILMVSDKTIHKACRTHKTLYNSVNPLAMIFFFFYYLPKLYIGFKVKVV